MKLSTSILSIKNDIEEKVKLIDSLDTDYIHLDIMDGKFVPNKTKDFKDVYEYVKDLNKPLDVHLMVNDVKKYVDKYSLLNPEFITFHIEATDNPEELINYIKSKNIKVGMSIKPNTDFEDLGPYLRNLDLILVMSVEPGRGGQEFLLDMEEKIDELRLLKNAYGYNYLIEVDGGINNRTVTRCLNADIVVVGSYITSSNDYEKSTILIMLCGYNSLL